MTEIHILVLLCGVCGIMTEPTAKRKKFELESGVSVVLGAQWGDEGKGKLVDILAAEADIVCRCQVCHFAVLSVH